VRQIAHDHMVGFDGEEYDPDHVREHVEMCVQKMATWPESLTIQYLLRDLEPEDFYFA
jgi:hypothetical protein